MTRMDALYAHAAAHHGVVSRKEALTLGLTANQVDYLSKKGQLKRAAPRVFVVAGSPRTWQQQARVAALSVDGLVSHAAAARLHGVDGFRRAAIELTVPKSRAPRTSAEILHRSTQYRLTDPVLIDAIPATGITRTVLDLAGVISYSRFDRVVDAVLRQKLCDWPDLYAVLAIHSIQGRNGCGPLRRLLDTRYGETAIPDSAWNRMVGQLLDRHGAPTPIYEHEIFDPAGRFIARVDLAYPRQNVAIELDSVRWHLNRQSFENDPRRKNKLLLQGWTVLTFTWSDYIDRPGALVSSVSAALQQAAA